MQEDRRNRDLAEVLREEMVIRDEIVSLLRGQVMTIPQIAEALGQPSDHVTQWIMSLWKYGQISDTGSPNEEGYYFYQLKE